MFDFSQNTEVTDLTSVPEEFKGLYVPVEGDESGKHVISDTAKGAVEAIINLNGVLTKARKEVKNLKSLSDLSELKDFGESPSEIKANIEAKIAEYQSKLTDGADAKLNFDTLKADLQKGHQAEKEAWEKEKSGLKGQLHEILVKKEAVDAIAKHKGDAKILLPFVEQHARVKADETTGKLNVYIVDENNDIRHSTVTGQPMTIDERVQEMKKDATYAKLYESDTQPNNGGGSGIQQNSTAQPVNTGGQGNDMSSTDMIKQGLSELQK